MTYIYTENDYLAHHGIKGMKWGVRKRYSDDGDADQDAKDVRRKKTIKRVAIGTAAVAGVLAVAGGIAYSKAKYDKNIELGAKAAAASRDAYLSTRFWQKLAEKNGEEKRNFDSLIPKKSNDSLAVDPGRRKQIEELRISRDASANLENEFWRKATDSYGTYVNENNKAKAYNDAAQRTLYGKHYAPIAAKAKERKRRKARK